MRSDEYASYDAIGLRALLTAGEVTARELHDVALQAIQDLDRDLNFMTVTAPEEADRALAQHDPDAPFAGVPFLMKESSGMKGLSAECGSFLTQGLMCEADGELVRRLKRSGLVTLGATNIPEFMNAITTESLMYGPARNPWNTDHSTGGSSGGSSAAVAARVVPMAQSSDGGGSIRVPAAFCGVFGLMPSRGRNPVGPSYGTNFGFLRQHVTTRSVRDSAAMLDHLSGPEIGALFRLEAPRGPYAADVGVHPGALRVAYSTVSPSGMPVDPACVEAVLKAVRVCEELGLSVEEAAPAYDWQRFKSAFGDTWAFTHNFIDQMGRQTGRPVDETTVERSSLLTVERGRSLSSARVHASFGDLHALARDVEGFFTDWDVFISPVALTPAPRLGTIDSNSSDLASFDDWFDRLFTGLGAFTPIYNATGQPAVSVPVHETTDNLPVGVQLVARIGDESTLIRLAAQLEQALPWAHRKPAAAVA
jgi:amidase